MTDTTDQTDQRDADDNVTDDDSQDTEELQAAGREALKRERAARRAAEKDAAETKRRLDAIEERDRKAADAKAKEDGKLEELLATREQERDTATGERDAHKAENDALTAYFSAEYTEALKDLPDVIKAFKPADDASFAIKSAWLTTAQQQAKTIARDIPRGNGPMPRGRESQDIDEKAALAQARRVVRI